MTDDGIILQRLALTKMGYHPREENCMSCRYYRDFTCRSDIYYHGHCVRNAFVLHVDGEGCCNNYSDQNITDDKEFS